MYKWIRINISSFQPAQLTPRALSIHRFPKPRKEMENGGHRPWPHVLAAGSVEGPMCPLSHPWLFTRCLWSQGSQLQRGQGGISWQCSTAYPHSWCHAATSTSGQQFWSLRKGLWRRTAKDTVGLLGPSHHKGQGVEWQSRTEQIKFADELEMRDSILLYEREGLWQTMVTVFKWVLRDQSIFFSQRILSLLWF